LQAVNEIARTKTVHRTLLEIVGGPRWPSVEVRSQLLEVSIGDHDHVVFSLAIC